MTHAITNPCKYSFRTAEATQVDQVKDGDTNNHEYWTNLDGVWPTAEDEAVCQLGIYACLSEQNQINKFKVHMLKVKVTPWYGYASTGRSITAPYS
jgi:hypothetical protein